MKSEPLATVMIITYNHAPYIQRAVESVIEQVTDFPFTVNVIEDCSTDGTQEILRSLKKKYGDRIELFLNEKNIGFRVTQKNFIRGFKTLKAKYISILEGDDYWGYTGKLQAQVDFLETRPEFVAFAHNTLRFHDDESRPAERFLPPSPNKSIHTVQNLIRIQSFFHTTTLIYRNVLKDNVPKKFSNPYSCDIFNAIAHADRGLFYYQNSDWSYYRVHEKGRFSNLSPVVGWFFNIDGLRRYNEWLNYRYLITFSQSLVKYSRHVLDQQKAGVARLTIYQRLKIRSLIMVYGSIVVLANCFTIPWLAFAPFFRMRPVDLNSLHHDFDLEWFR